MKYNDELKLSSKERDGIMDSINKYLEMPLENEYYDVIINEIDKTKALYKVKIDNSQEQIKDVHLESLKKMNEIFKIKVKEIEDIYGIFIFKNLNDFNKIGDTFKYEENNDNYDTFEGQAVFDTINEKEDDSSTILDL